LIPYGIKGVIWYQGESNAGRSKQYRVLLPTLISDWRQRWGEGPFFFDIVQLANNGQNTMPGADGDGMQAIRDAQMDTVETTINTGIAITDDIGDAVSDHPKDKVDVGSRLALAALAKGYGQKITYSGPVYTGSKIVGNQIIILFDHADGGLVAKGGGPLTGFSICDVHQNWVWADAKIDGANVDVSSSSIANPTAALFAWADNPSFNLYNGAGLPAAPFRTDRPAAGPY
jgi:sialate O-acetylesterase